MEVNYLGSVYPTRAVITTMKERRMGRIMFVSSQAGQIGLFGYTAYSPSKFALRGLAESLQMEVSFLRSETPLRHVQRDVLETKLTSACLVRFYTWRKSNAIRKQKYKQPQVGDSQGKRLLTPRSFPNEPLVMRTKMVNCHTVVWRWQKLCRAVLSTTVLLPQIKPYNIYVTLAYPPDTDTPGLAEENKMKVNSSLTQPCLRAFLTVTL